MDRPDTDALLFAPAPAIFKPPSFAPKSWRYGHRVSIIAAVRRTPAGPLRAGPGPPSPGNACRPRTRSIARPAAPGPACQGLVRTEHGEALQYGAWGSPVGGMRLLVDAAPLAKPLLRRAASRDDRRLATNRQPTRVVRPRPTIVA